MKLYIKTLGFLFLMSLGIQTSIAQEKIERKMAKAQSHVSSNEDIAKQQTENLNQLVNLSDDQVTKVHALYMDLQKRMDAAPTSEMDETKRTEYVKKMNALSDSKLKEILTEDQFTIYLKSERNE